MLSSCDQTTLMFEWCHSGDLSKWSHRSLLRLAFLLLVHHGDLEVALPIILTTVHTYCTEAARLIAEEAREREELERPIRERKEQEERERQEKERLLKEKQAELIAKANAGVAPETPEQPPKPPTPNVGMCQLLFCRADRFWVCKRWLSFKLCLWGGRGGVFSHSNPNSCLFGVCKCVI